MHYIYIPGSRGLFKNYQLSMPRRGPDIASTPELPCDIVVATLNCRMRLSEKLRFLKPAPNSRGWCAIACAVV